MQAPFFTSAYQSAIEYRWDSRTITGVLGMDCRNGQKLCFSTPQTVKDPGGGIALLIRGLGDARRRRFFSPQEIFAVAGDILKVDTAWMSVRAMTLVIRLDGRRRSFRCAPGWNVISAEIPVERDIHREKVQIRFDISGMNDGDICYLGTLKLELITRRRVEKLQFPFTEFRASADWHECDLSDLYVKSGSILDFSELVPVRDMDRLGRVTATADGHLGFAAASGERIRFFGHSMAITRSTIPATHGEIDAFVEALRNQGYNLVRIHGANALLMDASSGWDGTLPDKPENIPVASEAEERLHYFIHRLRQRGIYLYLDLCSFINGWHSGDVWINCGIWKTTPGGISRYSTLLLAGDPAVRANYRAGVLRLMTALNPYTGKRLADDPVIAFVLGFNELLISECDEIKALRKRMRKSEARFQYEVLTETAQFIDRIIAETGYDGLVNQYDNGRMLVNLAVGNRYPMTTNHVYHWCPHKFFYPGSSQGRSGSLFSGLGYFRQAARLRSLGKPYGITEYGEAYWNRFRFCQGLGFSSGSAFQDFDMLVMHSTPVMKSGGELRPFSAGNDPAARASEAVAACAFLRRDVAPGKCRAVWEFDRKYMEKNFDRLTESTISFAALLVKVGLAYECHPEAEFRFPLDVSEEGAFFGPEFFRKFTGSGKLNALVTLLRERGVLASGNSTDVSRGIYENETGEIRIDIMSETMKVVTPRLEGAVVAAGKEELLPHLEIHSPDVEAAVTLIARDGLVPLGRCRRLLLVCGTNALNTGSRFLAPEAVPQEALTDTEGRVLRPEQRDEEILLDNGHLPVLRRNFRARLAVVAPGIARPTVYAVKFNGERACEVPSELRGGRLEFCLGGTAVPSPFYEIVGRR